VFAIVALGLDGWLSIVIVIVLVIVGPAAREVEEGAACRAGEEQRDAEHDLGGDDHDRCHGDAEGEERHCGEQRHHPGRDVALRRA
jgi:hypothetical protein